MLPVPLLAAVTLSLSDGSGAEARSDPQRKSASIDLTTSPALALAVTGKRSVFGAAYRPSFSWVDVTRDPDFIVQHNASAGYAWGTARLRLSLGVTASYGEVTFVTAAAQAAAPVQAPVGDTGAAGMPTPGQPAGQPAAQPGQMPGTQAQTTQVLPQLSVLQTGSVVGLLGLNYLISRRWGASFGIGYSLGGGLRASEAYLPLHYGPSASAGVGYELTQDDALTSSLTGSLDILPKRHSRFETITVLESWRHSFDALTSGIVGGGASYVQGRERGEPTSRSMNAAGLVGISRTVRLDGGAHLGLNASANLSSYYNPVLGTVTQSLAGGAGVSWSRKRLTFAAGIQASHSLPLDDPNAFRAYGATAGAGYQVSPLLSLRAGGYWAHQILPPSALLTNANPDNWAASIGVNLSAPPIKF